PVGASGLSPLYQLVMGVPTHHTKDKERERERDSGKDGCGKYPQLSLLIPPPPSLPAAECDLVCTLSAYAPIVGGKEREREREGHRGVEVVPLMSLFRGEDHTESESEATYTLFNTLSRGVIGRGHAQHAQQATKTSKASKKGAERERERHITLVLDSGRERERGALITYPHPMSDDYDPFGVERSPTPHRTAPPPPPRRKAAPAPPPAVHPRASVPPTAAPAPPARTYSNSPPPPPRRTASPSVSRGVTPAPVPRKTPARSASASKPLPADASKRERELDRRERELAKREAEFRTARAAAAKGGAMVLPPNWPPFMPLARVDVDTDIIDRKDRKFVNLNLQMIYLRAFAYVFNVLALGSMIL
ncbi:secretory carrier membrane protein, partial [Kipferlia bialata]